MNIFKLLWTGLKELKDNLKSMKLEHQSYKKEIKLFNKSVTKQYKLNDEI